MRGHLIEAQKIYTGKGWVRSEKHSPITETSLTRWHRVKIESNRIGADLRIFLPLTHWVVAVRRWLEAGTLISFK